MGCNNGCIKPGEIPIGEIKDCKSFETCDNITVDGHAPNRAGCFEIKSFPLKYLNKITKVKL